MGDQEDAQTILDATPASEWELPESDCQVTLGKCRGCRIGIAAGPATAITCKAKQTASNPRQVSLVQNFLESLLRASPSSPLLLMFLETDVTWRKPDIEIVLDMDR